MVRRPEPREVTPEALGIGVLFNTVREGVIAAEADTGRIVLWNDAAQDIFGHSAAEAVGQLVEMIIPGDLRPRHRAGMEGYRATGHGRFIDARTVLELPAVRRDGAPLVVEMTLNPLEHPRWGRYVFAILRDVTERKRAQETLRRQTLSHPLVRRIVETLIAMIDAPAVTISALGAEIARGVDARTADDYVRAFLDAGLGELSLVAEASPRWTFEGNDLLERHAGATQPTCHLALGHLEGAVGALGSGQARGAEVTCQSLGHPKCRFVVMLR